MNSENSSSDTETESRCTLRARTFPERYGIFPEPRPSDLYVDRETSNMVTSAPIPEETQFLSDWFESVALYQQLGWIIALGSEVELRFESLEGGKIKLRRHPHPAQNLNGIYMSNIISAIGHNHRYPAIVLNTFWVMDLPAGVSLLLLPSGLEENKGFQPIPQYICIDNYPGFVEIPIRMTATQVKFESGVPLAKGLPIDRKAAVFDAYIQKEATNDFQAENRSTLGFIPRTQGSQTLPQPRSGTAHLEATLGEVSNDSNRGPMDQRVLDALRIGWCFPCQEDIEVSRHPPSTGVNSVSNSETNQSAISRIRPISTDSGLERKYIRMDTGWSVMAPDGYSLLTIPVFASERNGYDVIYEVLQPTDEGTSSAIKINPLIRINSDTVTFDRGQPIVTILPVKDSIFELATKTGMVSTEERVHINRFISEMARRNVYRDEIRDPIDTPLLQSNID